MPTDASVPPGPGPERPKRTSAPPAIELRHLRYFLAVSDELHFGRAAERLHIAQPALSQAIRRLEEELGILLFERTSRAVVPTRAGRVFAAEADKGLAGISFAVAEARRAAAADAVMRIGCNPDLPLGRLLRFLAALERLTAEVRTDVAHLSTLEQIRLVREGELDFAMFAQAEPHDGIHTLPVFDGEPLHAFVRPEHAAARADAVRPEDVRDQTLAIFRRARNPALHDRMLAHVRVAGYQFRDVREVGGSTARDILLGVAAGLGVGLAPASLAASDAAALVVSRPLEPPVRLPETVIGWRTDASRRVQPLLPTVRALAGELRTSDG